MSTGGGVLEVAGDAFATLSPRVVVLVLASSIGLRNIVVVLVPLCLSNWLIGLVAPRHRLQKHSGAAVASDSVCNCTNVGGADGLGLDTGGGLTRMGHATWPQ